MPNKTRRRYFRVSRALLIGAAVGGILLFLLHIFICSWTEASPLVSGLAMLFAYALLLPVGILLDRMRASRREAEEAAMPAIGSVMMETVSKIDIPCLITDETGSIIWYNHAWLSLSGRRDSLYGMNATEFCPLTIADLIQNDCAEGTPVAVSGRCFRVRAYRLPLTGQNVWLSVFTEDTALVNLAARAAREQTIVAYIVLDNIEELAQYVRESFRSAASEIEQILKRWAKEMNAVLTEYDRDRYLLVMNAANLADCVEHKFAVFDEIRNVRIGDNGMSLTVSMGVSTLGETLAERARNASAALDTALQRGGDQVALKTAEGVEFYGGRTKSVQKRTKVRARIISSELCTLIAGAGNILIMGHRYPDFDSIGACVGVARLCMFCGVRAKIVLSRDDANVRACIGKIASSEEYEDVFVDSAAGLDLVRSDTLLIVVDVNNFEFVEAPEIAGNVHTIAVIDHHRKTMGEHSLALTYIEPSASSACELIAEILEQCLPQGGLRAEEANLMLSGMLLDTKQFSTNTGTRTFSAALYLRSEGANPGEVQRFFRSDLDDFVREARFASNVVIYRGSVAIAYFDGEGQATDRVAAAKAANKLLTVRSVAASFALVRIDDAVHISARSDGSINVQLIMESMGGGGHFDSAGGQVASRSVSDALNLLKSAIDQYLDGK